MKSVIDEEGIESCVVNSDGKKGDITFKVAKGFWPVEVINMVKERILNMDYGFGEAVPAGDRAFTIPYWRDKNA